MAAANAESESETGKRGQWVSDGKIIQDPAQTRPPAWDGRTGGTPKGGSPKKKENMLLVPMPRYRVCHCYIADKRPGLCCA